MRQLILTEKQIRSIVESTVETTLARVGFDSNNYIDMQADLAFLRHLRKSNQATSSKIKTSIIWSVVTIAAGSIWYGLKSFLGNISSF